MSIAAPFSVLMRATWMLSPCRVSTFEMRCSRPNRSADSTSMMVRDSAASVSMRMRVGHSHSAGVPRLAKVSICVWNSGDSSGSSAWVINFLNVSRSGRLAKPPVRAFTTRNVSRMIPSPREKTRALRMFSPAAAKAPEMVVNSPGRSHVQIFTEVWPRAG